MSDIFKQFFKFLIVGLNNTGIDFLILNLLMFSFNIYYGLPVIFFNIISFTVAVTNSYLINRFWTFKKEENQRILRTQIILAFIIFLILFNLKFLKEKIVFVILSIVFFTIVLWINIFVVKNFLLKEKISESSKEFLKFVILTIMGMIINTTVFYSLISFVSPLFNFSKVLWANFSKAVATVVSLFWNFICYKFIVFKNKLT